MAPIRELALHLLLQKENNVPFPVLLEQAYAKIPESGHNTQKKPFLWRFATAYCEAADFSGKSFCLSAKKAKPCHGNVPLPCAV